MQVNKVQNNSPAFGIKYVNKQAWNADVLKAFENSKLVEEIDNKYKDAVVRYIKVSGEDSIINEEFIHTLVLDIKLSADKLFRWNLSSHFESVPEKQLINDLEGLSLKTVEKESVESVGPLEIMEVRPKKENPIKSFLKRFIPFC